METDRNRDSIRRMELRGLPGRIDIAVGIANRSTCTKKKGAKCKIVGYQISEKADALLYLSLLSGRNPDYLIGQHTRTAKEISEMDIEIIPTAYLLIDGGNSCAVAYVSQTTPMPQNQINLIESTVLAGILQGKSLVYLDAGSGAKDKVSAEIISKCAQHEIPTIVGGGIRSIEEINEAKDAGANVVVIGNYIEENIDFLLDIAQFQTSQLH